MSRSLTPEEKNQIKNLQVSNSIYRRQVKELVEEAAKLQTKRDQIQSQMDDLTGEELTKTTTEIESINAELKQKVGQIAYKEARINEKSIEIDNIKTKAVREEEEPTGPAIDVNSPEFRERFGNPEDFPVEDKPAAKKSTRPKSTGKKKK